MSGQAGSSIDSRYYGVFFGSGISEDVAPPPDDDGSSIGQYFADASRPFERTLQLARPALDELFAEWAARGHVPLTTYDQERESIAGALIQDLSRDEDEDALAAHFAEYHRGGPCLVSLSRTLEDMRCINLQLLVTDRVRESELEPILQEVTAILSKAYGKADESWL